MQRLLESETRTEKLLTIRLMHLVVEYAFSRGHVKNPNPVNRVDLCPITFASLTPIGNNRGSFGNKRHLKEPSRLEPLQQRSI